MRPIKYGQLINPRTGFSFVMTCYILSFSTEGFGNYLFGYGLFTNVSTLFIYLALVFQMITLTVRFPKILLIVYSLILIQTFVINFNLSTILPSLKQFLGIIVFSVSIFSFVTVYKDRIVDIMVIYYKYVYFVVILAIFEVFFFVIFGISFVPQNIISGSTTSLHSQTFKVEILNIFPRAIGLSTEPAHFAAFILPGVYLSLLVLTGKGDGFNINNKIQAVIILLGLIMSFSMVGYFGLGLCLIIIFGNQLKHNIIKKILILIPVLSLMYFIFSTPVGSKVTSLINMMKNAKNYEYRSSNETGWAIVSNLMVTREGLVKSNYLGTGLNTHMNTYDAYIHKIFKDKTGSLGLNKAEASSMFIRITSEFGIPGILTYLFFLFHFMVGRRFPSSAIKSINNISFVLLITYSLRTGHYICDYYILFIALFYTTYMLQRYSENNLVIAE
jgi:hypothetical protein